MSLMSVKTKTSTPAASCVNQIHRCSAKSAVRIQQALRWGKKGDLGADAEITFSPRGRA